MEELSRPFVEDLAIVLGVCAVTAVLFRRLRQPVVLGYLLAGFIVGPHTPFPLFAEPERIHGLANLGVILVMFSIGLEFSVRRLMRVVPTAGLVGLIQLTTMMSLGYLAGRAFGWSSTVSIFAGAMIAISSTMMVARVFADYKVSERVTELVYGVLIVQDLAAILLIALLTTLASRAEMPTGALAESAGELLLFLAVIVLVGFLVVPRFMRLVARLGSQETLLVVSVGLCFSLALLAHKVGYSVALGAFLAGSLAAESGRAHLIETTIRPLRDMFAAVFFVAVGMLVEPASLVENIPEIAVFLGLVLAGMTISITIGAFLGGNGLKTSVMAGMSLAQIGEFSFIIVGVGVTTGAVDSWLYGVAISVSVITAFTTPWMVRAGEPVALWLDRKLPKPIQTFTALYSSWIEELRRSEERPRSVTRRLVRFMLIDVICLAALALATSMLLGRVTTLLGQASGLAETAARAVVLAVPGLLSIPFWIGLMRTSRKLGATLLSGPEEVGTLDMAAAPRRAFVVTIQLAVVVLVGAPLLALVQNVIPLIFALPLFAAVVVGLGILFWQRATNLQEHVRAGAHLVAEVLGKQSGEEPRHLQEAEPLLPGLGALTSASLPPDSAAVGKTLADLDLRGRTGASVLVITRKDGDVITPTGREPLRAGDVLALSGTHDSIEAARRALEERSSEQPLDAVEGAGERVEHQVDDDPAD